MIYFRETKEPHFKAADVATCWQVEAYSDEGTMFPVGIAYVTEIPNRGAQLQFVFVADQWRRQGFGKEMLKAILQRWPECHWTGDMDHRGEALLRTVGMIHADDE